MPSDKGKFIGCTVLLTPAEHAHLMDHAKFEGKRRGPFMRDKLKPWLKPSPSVAISRANLRGKVRAG